MNKYLKQLLDALAAKNLELQGHMTKSLDAGQTPDEDTEAAIQAVEKEIEAIEKNIARVRKQIEEADKAAKTATPVDGQSEQGAKDTAEGKTTKTVVTTSSNLPKGVPFAQFARAKMLACHEQKQGNILTVVEAAKQLGYSQDTIQYIEKATLGTTTDVGFAAPLVQQDTYKGDFLELLRNATIFDKLKGFRSVPFNV